VFRQVCIGLRCTVRRESRNLRDARCTPSDRFAGMRFVWILPSHSVLLDPIVRRIVANCGCATPPSFSPFYVSYLDGYPMKLIMSTLLCRPTRSLVHPTPTRRFVPAPLNRRPLVEADSHSCFETFVEVPGYQRQSGQAPSGRQAQIPPALSTYGGFTISARAHGTEGRLSPVGKHTISRQPDSRAHSREK
jgi:hypothetical protein